MQKRVIQVYKAPHQWVNGPPGLGDFVRGTCHLFEKLEVSGMEFRVDISQTEFFHLIEHDESIFQVGDEGRIASAEEYFVDHVALHHRIIAFQHSTDSELYICTNLGAWHRPSLNDATCEFIKKFYRFNAEIERMTAQALPATGYEVLSVRCGDSFYSDPNSRVQANVEAIIFSLIEQKILPTARFPVVITSDCYELKCELARRYGMLMLPHKPSHGAYGNALPVAMDLCLLKHSRTNHHINTWASWWSGFSHYTSIIFKIPSINYRAPSFVQEEVNAQGVLITAT